MAAATTTTVMAGVDNNDDDSDFDERDIKGATTHQGVASATTTVSRGGALGISSATATTTTTTGSKTTFSIRSMGSGICACCCCFFGTIMDCLEKTWKHYNRFIVAILFLIGIIFTIGMVAFFGARYNYRLSNPSEFHYTTCFISNIHSYKDDDDNWHNKITFVYSTDSSDWTQEGLYEIEKDDWNSDNHEGDLGTCVYSTDSTNWADQFTIKDYLIHSDTSAMWLILDGKMGLISWIIFFVFSFVFMICGCIAWLVRKCEYVEFTVCGLGGSAVFVLGCMLVGWPLLIMGSIVMSGLDNELADGILVEYVYEYMDDCIIDGVEGTKVYYPENTEVFPFTLVKYDVFTNDGNMIAVDINNGTNTTYFGINSVQYCYKNKYTQQVMLNSYPDVEWLQLPMKRGTGIVVLVCACLLICAPCTIACLGVCSN